MAEFFNRNKRDPRIEKYLSESENRINLASLRAFLQDQLYEALYEQTTSVQEAAGSEEVFSSDVHYSLEEPSCDSSFGGSLPKKGRMSYAYPPLTMQEEFNSFMQSLNRETGPSFSAEVKRYMDEKCLKPSSVYHDAQVLRQTYSKINKDNGYRPSRDTAIQICFALHLTFEEAEQLLNRAGYHFSTSEVRDLIFQFFFQHSCFNLMDINNALYDQNQTLLGSRGY